MAGIVRYEEGVLDSIHKTVKAAHLAGTRAGELRVDLLEARRAEKDFLLRHDLKYAETHAALRKSVLADIEHLRHDAHEADLDKVTANADNLVKGLETYFGHFRDLTAQMVALGLDENSGLSGTLRKSVRALESRIAAVGDNALMVTVLTIRRHEKDFMLRRAPSYIESVKKSVAMLVQQIDGAAIPSEMQTEMKKEASAYLKDFLEWANTEQGFEASQAQLSQAFRNVEPLLTGILKDVEAAVAELDRRAEEIEEGAKLQLMAAMLIIAVVVGGLCVTLGRSVSRPVKSLIPELHKIAGGQFNIKLDSLGRRDEIGDISRAVDEMASKVRETVSIVVASGREVANATTEISTGTTDLSHRTEEQAASLEETSAAMEEMSATVRRNAENAQNASASASRTRDVATHGAKIANKAVEAMARIEQSSHKIGDIITVIDEIARQTNLLALNAAVEAARAGEAGRGFAVVASEVRSLAQRSSQAAKDIKELITNSTGLVSEGVDLVNQAGASLNEIAGSVDEAVRLVAEIAAASREQASGIEDINKALMQMDQATQENSALVEENAAVAKTLEHQAKVMDEQMSFFQVDVPGAAVPAERGEAQAEKGRSMPQPMMGRAA
ncbi:methyl-accepting chemotaxis protein [Undibacter mobilis]|nr:methyl-accepting chemotaxis protein [Undibacter mobilis]